MERLRAFADQTAPAGVSVVVTLTAPIRVPGRTAEALKGEIAALLAGGRPEASVSVHGNGARLRRVEAVSPRALKLVGFVHNPDVDITPLLDLAERWLRGQS